ncbi:hypothetical protein GIB67_008228 [Kingdonia uniflora]|uniref:WRKY19-like zinc finger domain-containing protein n=1 Tax=Kingdonia uniflora TaxID=39325 RepID=A0A7J7N4I0_9MAGN|nr:hypothetical protein GIB67_008228 [Kingdonia uniflora]
MDMGKNNFYVSESGAPYCTLPNLRLDCTDTDLRLDSPGASFSYLSTSKGIKRKWCSSDGSLGPENRSFLINGLGHSQSSSDSKGSSATACTIISSAKETDEESSMDLNLDFDLHLGNDKTFNRKSYATPKSLEGRPKLDLELSLSTGPAESDVTSVTFGSNPFQNNLNMSFMVSSLPFSDEGIASSADKLQNYVPLMPNLHSTPTTPDFSPTMATTSKSSGTSFSGGSQPPQQRCSNAKICLFMGCGKGARGASGLCIAHGGGRRCERAGCHKGAEGRTVFCKAHGGGRRCQQLGCTKSAEGRTDHCIAHGGGRRCSFIEGCTRAARGKSGLCIRHGGGKRCQVENCTKSAEGFSGRCISHGGGRRCHFAECTKGAQGSTMFCKAHGGGKRCTVDGCTKGAEGSTPYCKGHGGGKRCSWDGGGVCPKSVHGGTLYCVAHGGGKRCAVPECTKSARGRTDHCVRHGGGKRCKSDGCGKSAQGSTDFCKAHGGGKRCSWDQDATPCDRFARGKTGFCASHSALVTDKRVHGGETLGPTISDPNVGNFDKMKEVITVEDVQNHFETYPATSLQLPPHFQMPITGPGFLQGPSPVLVPEGRVHGGSLMAMLTGNSVGTSSNTHVPSGPSESGKSYMMPHKWM